MTSGRFADIQKALDFFNATALPEIKKPTIDSNRIELCPVFSRHRSERQPDDNLWIV